MPRKPPAEPIDHHYDIGKLTRVFALSGLILLVTSVAMIWTDYASGWSYTRSWKGYQLRFLQWDRYKTQKDVAAAREKVEYDAARSSARPSGGSRKAAARLRARSRTPTPSIPRRPELRFEKAASTRRVRARWRRIPGTARSKRRRSSTISRRTSGKSR
jgi:hypothetical protein